jgi:uncharacterized protein DUF6152
MRNSWSVGFLLASVLATGSVLAHHSAVAEYDLEKPISINGTIKRVEWQNPHIWYYLDVKEKDGSLSEWGVSGGAPGQLMRRGITKDVLKIGAVVSVEGFLARDGSKNMTGRRVTFADGRDVFTAGPEQQR